jgi:hypothetical protein
MITTLEKSSPLDLTRQILVQKAARQIFVPPKKFVHVSKLPIYVGQNFLWRSPPIGAKLTPRGKGRLLAPPFQTATCAHPWVRVNEGVNVPFWGSKLIPGIQVHP